MKDLINLQGKEQLRYYSAQSRLLEYLGIQQEKLLRTGLSVNIVPLGIIYQVTDMVNFFFSGPCKKRSEGLLKLSRHQLRLEVAFLIGHAPVRKHLNIMGLFDGDPTCRFCRSETETVTILFVVARCWLVNAIISLGSYLLNQKI
jgi:hypothetical protein